MMAFTTLLLAVPIVLILYFLLLRKIRFSIINYLIVIIVGGLFFMGGVLHLIYIGIEIILVGILTVFATSSFHKRDNKSY